MINQLIILVIFSTALSAQNFEGVLVFKRTANNGNIAYEKYYLKDSKLRIDSEFHIDGEFKDYSSIYLFKEYMNQVFQRNNITRSYFNKELKPSRIDSVVDMQTTEEISGYSASKYIIYNHPLQYFERETLTTQEVWLANDLYFTLPQDWNNSPYMLSHFDGRIILKMIETGTSDGETTYRYEREIVDVSEIVLDTSLFDIK